MNARLLAASLVVALCAPGAALAQKTAPGSGDEASRKADAVAPFTAMHFFYGTWSCKVTQAPRADMIGTGLTVTIASGPGTHYDHADGPGGTSYVTYDAQKKVFTSITIDPERGGYIVTNSPGWDGDTLTWTDVLVTGGDALATRTYKKTGPNSFDNTVVYAAASGPITVSVSCTRNA